jgi:hypothetical protein
LLGHPATSSAYLPGLPRFCCRRAGRVAIFRTAGYAP